MARGEAILFDLDGVLVDSWSVARRALTLALRETGHQDGFCEQSFRDSLGKPLQAILSDLGLPAAAMAPFNRHALALTHEVTVFAEVPEALASLRARGYRLGVVTGKQRERALAVFESTPLGGLIDWLVTPDDAPGKPDAAALRACMAGLGVGQALCYVGDTSVDLETARTAGVAPVLAMWGASERMRLLDWALVAERPSDLTESFLARLVSPCGIVR
jgi:phosphoglycolate phosphatase-like HAD superfamily hydrolase